MGDFGPKSDPRLIPILMEWLCKRKELPQNRGLPNTLSKNPTGRSKDSPVGYKRGTAWSKDFPVRYKRSTAWSKDFPVGYKRSTARLKDFPLGENRGTAWSKDSPVRYKKVLVGRRLSSRVENRDRTVAFGPNARELQPRRNADNRDGCREPKM